MKVAVLVPAYNAEKTIEQTCAALAKQTFPEFEVLILDDGSTDRTVELASQYFPVHSGPHMGPDATRNRGISLTDAQYLLFTDADCVVDAEWVGELVATLDTGYDGVVGKTIGVPFSESALCKEFVRRRAAARIQQDAWRTEYYFPTCNVAYRRAVLEALGNFPVNRHQAGDTVFSRKVGKHGFRCVINTRAVLHHYLATNYAALLRRYVRDGRGHRRLRWYNLVPMAARIALAPVHFFMVALYHLSVLDASQDNWYQEIIIEPLVDTTEYTLYYVGTLWQTLLPEP